MRRSFFSATASAVALALLASAAGVVAYTTNGYSWGSRVVTYYVNPSNLYVPDAAAATAVQAGAAVWNTQGGADVQLSYGGTTSRNSLALDYTNNVFFRNDTSSALAETYWWWDGSGRLIDADIVFHQNYKAYVNGMACAGDGYYIESTVAHEFGHALGLGHSSVLAATMYPTVYACDTSFQTLDADDVTGLRSLYPAAAVTAPSTPASPSPSNGATGVPTSVTLSWSASGAQTYDLYLGGRLYAAGLTRSSYAVSGLALGTRFTWNVVARNSVGSTAGPAWAFTTALTTSTPTRGKGKR